MTEAITSDKEWQACWICDREFASLTPIDVFHKQLAEHAMHPHRDDLKNRRMFARKTFSIETAASPYIDITADDHYKLYVNGVFAAEGPSPAYHFHYRYDRIDLSTLLKPGENVIAVDVYYQGTINRVWQSGDYRQGLIAEISNGGNIVLVTDASWKYTVPTHSTGKTVGYETQYLENIDERAYPHGWTKIGYDDSSWLTAAEMKHDHVLVRQETPLLSVYRMEPSSVKRAGNGRYIVDFGKEIVGFFTCDAFGAAGDTVEIRHGEELHADGNVRSEMRCNVTYQEIWTLSGRTPDTLAYYDYKAFRYVEVTALKPDIRIEKFAANVRHYPCDDALCTFESSGVINDVFAICKNGVRMGTQELFLDCPSREKGQYLGDLTVAAHSHLYLTGGDGRLFRKAMRDFADSMRICPGLMAVAPGSFMQEIADYSLQWPLQLMTYYRHTGDRAFLAEMYPRAREAVAYFKRYDRGDGLIENVSDKWNLVDWPENLRDGYDFDLDPKGAGKGAHAVLNGFYVSALRSLNEMRYALGESPDDEDIRSASAFIDAFYRPDTKLFADSAVSQHASLHTNTLALFTGLVPAEAADAVLALMRSKRLACGVYMSYFVLKGLARYGAYDLIFDLISGTDIRSWGNMVKEGATACFEAWGKDQKWNTSLCHPWASAPIPVLIEDIIGVSPKTPGWGTISFAPHMPPSMPDLLLTIQVPTARVSVEKHGADVAFSVEANDAPVEFMIKGKTGLSSFYKCDAGEQEVIYLD